MSTPDLGAIRQRLAAAWPGPWYANFYADATEFPVWARDDLDGTMEPHHLLTVYGEPQRATPTVELIIHVPTDLAALCDRVERLEARLLAVRAEGTASLHPCPCDQCIQFRQSLAADPPTEGE